jgi:hypothetical protein
LVVEGSALRHRWLVFDTKLLVNELALFLKLCHSLAEVKVFKVGPCFRIVVLFLLIAFVNTFEIPKVQVFNVRVLLF